MNVPAKLPLNVRSADLRHAQRRSAGVCGGTRAPNSNPNSPVTAQCASPAQQGTPRMRDGGHNDCVHRARSQSAKRSHLPFRVWPEALVVLGKRGTRETGCPFFTSPTSAMPYAPCGAGCTPVRRRSPSTVRPSRELGRCTPPTRQALGAPSEPTHLARSPRADPRCALVAGPPQPRRGATGIGRGNRSPIHHRAQLAPTALC